MVSPITPSDPPALRRPAAEKPPARGPRIATIALPLTILGVLTVADPGAMRAVVSSIVGSPTAIAIVLGVTAGVIGISALARRWGISGWAHTAAVLVPLGIITGLYVGPYFTSDTVVEEDFPVALGSAVQDTSADPGAGVDEADANSIEDAVPAPGTELAQPAADPATTSDIDVAAEGDEPVTAMAPEPAEPLELGRGDFVGLDNHRAEGQAAAYDLGDGTQLVRLEDIDVQQVPEPHVYIVPVAGAAAPTDDAVSLGPLKGNVGSQNYEVPAGIDLSSGEWTVLIWCEPFRSPVGGATLS